MLEKILLQLSVFYHEILAKSLHSSNEMFFFMAVNLCFPLLYLLMTFSLLFIKNKETVLKIKIVCNILLSYFFISLKILLVDQLEFNWIHIDVYKIDIQYALYIVIGILFLFFIINTVRLFFLNQNKNPP